MGRRKAAGLRVQIATEQLQVACNRVRTVVEKDAASPGRSCALLHGEAGRLSVSGYDLENQMNSLHDAEIVSPGSVAIPVKLLKQLADVAPGNVVEIEALEGSRVIIRSGSMESEIAGLNPDEVTTVAIPDSMGFAPIDAAALLALIDAVKHAVCGDQTRGNLCGALLERTQIGWRMVSTDGHRMAVLERSIEDANVDAVEGKVFLSGKSLAVFQSALGEDDSTTGQLGFAQNLVVFRRAGLEILSRLPENQFPDWKLVVPETVGHTVSISRQALHRAVQRMAPISSRAGQKVVLHFGRNILRLRAEASDYGLIRDSLAIEHEGVDLTLAISSSYLTDALNSLDCEMVTIGVEDSLSPVVVRPLDSQTSVCIVMPQRVEVADIEAIEADELATVFEPLRSEFQQQNRRSAALEQVRKVARDAAKASRREAGGPITQGETQWPPSGFWSDLEIRLGRLIPEDERKVGCETYWAEATRPLPAKEEVAADSAQLVVPTRVATPEDIARAMDAGQTAGYALLDTTGGVRTVWTKNMWPGEDLLDQLQKSWGYTFLPSELAAAVNSFKAVATIEIEQKPYYEFGRECGARTAKKLDGRRRSVEHANRMENPFGLTLTPALTPNGMDSAQVLDLPEDTQSDAVAWGYRLEVCVDIDRATHDGKLLGRRDLAANRGERLPWMEALNFDQLDDVWGRTLMTDELDAAEEAYRAVACLEPEPTAEQINQVRALGREDGARDAEKDGGRQLLTNDEAANIGRLNVPVAEQRLRFTFGTRLRSEYVTAYRLAYEPEEAPVSPAVLKQMTQLGFISGRGEAQLTGGHRTLSPGQLTELVTEAIADVEADLKRALVAEERKAVADGYQRGFEVGDPPVVKEKKPRAKKDPVEKRPST